MWCWKPGLHVGPWSCTPASLTSPCALQGLEDVIGLSVTHPTWQRTRPDQDEHCGWAFASPDGPPLSSSTGHGSFTCEGCIPDPINGAQFVRDLYEKSSDTSGACSWSAGGGGGRCIKAHGMT